MLRNLCRQSWRRKTKERHYCNVGGAQQSSQRKIAITHSPCQTTWSTYTSFFFLPQRYQRSHFFVLFALAGRGKNPDCRRRGRRPHSPWLLSPRSLDEEWDFVPPSPSDWGSHGPNATSWGGDCFLTKKSRRIFSSDPDIWRKYWDGIEKNYWTLPNAEKWFRQISSPKVFMYVLFVEKSLKKLK